MSDRTKSSFTQHREQREQVAVALSTERLPWHPAVGERFGIERSDWRALVEAVFPAAKTSEGVILALSYCKARNLDPFKRVVHVVPIWDKVKRGYVETVWPGIGEARTTAMRTKQFAGCDDTKFGPDIDRSWTMAGDDDDRGGKSERQVTITFPEWAQVTVYRKMGEERWAVPGPRVYWMETYATRGRTLVPNDMWIKRPRGQLEKCAEAAALRRAFPEELGDEATADEMGDYSGPVIDQDGNPAGTVDKAAEPAREEPKVATPSKPAHTPHGSPTKGPVAPRQKIVDDPDDWRNDRGETIPQTTTVRTEPKVDVSAPATQRQADPTPKVEPVQTNTPPVETVPTSPADTGFEAWIVDEDGAETTADPYFDAVTFANALKALCSGKTTEAFRIIMDNNEGAIRDCCDASDQATVIITAIVPAEEKKQEPAKASTPAPAATGPAVIAVPTTPGGKPHWPNYVLAMKAHLDEATSAEDAAARFEANKLSYVKKATIAAETQIERHYQAVMAKFAPVSAPVRQQADELLAEIRNCTTADQLNAMNTRPEVPEILMRWRTEHPDIFKEVVSAAKQRLTELSP